MICCAMETVSEGLSTGRSTKIVFIDDLLCYGNSIRSTEHRQIWRFSKSLMTADLEILEVTNDASSLTT
jgi:hypothetical protein